MVQTQKGLVICLDISVDNRIIGLACGSDGKEFACNAGDPCSISGLGRSPGEGNGNPLQYFSLENPMDRGAWWTIDHGVVRNGHDLVIIPPTYTITVPPLFFVEVQGRTIQEE